MYFFFLLYSAHVVVDGSKLHLRDVNLTNDGVYQCVVKNKDSNPLLVSATWVHVKGTGTYNIVKFSLTDDHVKHWRNYSIIFHQESRI